MQLTRPRRRRATASRLATAVVALASFAAPGSPPAAGDDQVRAAVTYFAEPAPNTNLNVVHPQVSYSQDFGDHFGLAVGYDADVVSGATPQVFGVDAVTAATKFTDARHNGSLGLRFLSEYATLRLGGGFAGEHDYRSGTVNAGITTELFDRNTQLSVDYTHNFDRVCDANNAANQELLELRALDSSELCFRKDSDQVATRKLAIDTAQITWTQVTTPWLLLQFGATGQVLRGFQANPYRQVLLGERAVQEHLPGVRNRIAPWARAKFALKPIRGSIEADLRGYFDSWSVKALTAELAWDQYIARPIVLRARARWHMQDSALFYRDGNQYASSGPIGSYWTGDRELSALFNSVYGVKATYFIKSRGKQFLRFIDQFVISAKADMIFYRSRTANPQFSPNYDRTKGLLDAVVIQAQAGFDF
ncbi:MAG: DUF3570 domain-containing protein [Nannocystaceae bacterium]|nr:DUF3570 domain-containing protein [Nannocystaceae bacterium]